MVPNEQPTDRPGLLANQKHVSYTKSKLKLEDTAPAGAVTLRVYVCVDPGARPPTSVL